MHFVAERTALAGALSAAVKIAERNASALIASQVLMHCRAGQLAVTATNYDATLRTVIPVQGQADGAACLPAHKLADIVKAAPDGAQVEIAPGNTGDAGQGGQFSVRFSRSRFTLPALAGDEFPSMVIGDGENATFTLTRATLGRLLSVTAPFMAGKDHSRYVLCGIYLHRDGGELIAASCDGHRVSRVGIAAPEAAAGPLMETGVIVPDMAVKLLQALPSGDVTIQLTANLMTASWGNTTLTTRLVDGTYPEYRQFFALGSGNDVTVTADAKIIRAAAARVALATGDKSHQIKLVAAPDGAVTLTAAGENGESGAEEIPAETTAGIAAGFNAKYLTDAMDVCGDDRIALSLKSTDDGHPTMSPCIISPAGDAAVRLLVMPMRVA